jgi:hypothetical protein
MGADLLSSSSLSSSESLSNARMMKGPVVRPKSAVTDNSRHDTLPKCNSRIKQESHPSVLTFLLPLACLLSLTMHKHFVKRNADQLTPWNLVGGSDSPTLAPAHLLSLWLQAAAQICKT